MNRPITYLAAAILVIHGEGHLLGTTVYLELAEIDEFSYKTTLLGGAVDIGDTGMAVFGVLWAVAAVGFVAAAGALVTDREQWRPLLAGIAVLSLVLTVLDYMVAYAGVAVNLEILAGVAISLRS